jgi:hypothetical protein
VQAHEGKVWARSAIGKGTSFVLRLRRLDHDNSASSGDSSISASDAALQASAGGSSRG